MLRFFLFLWGVLASCLGYADLGVLPPLPEAGRAEEIRYALEIHEQVNELSPAAAAESPSNEPPGPPDKGPTAPFEPDSLEPPSDEPTPEELRALDEMPPITAVGEEGMPPTGEEAEQAPAGLGVIEGEVFEAASGKGLAGVIIELRGQSLSTRTEPSGKYRLEGLRPGSYELTFTKAGYLLETREVSLLDVSLPFPLSMGLERRPVDTSEDVFVMEEYEVVEDYVEEDSSLELILGQSDGTSFTSGIGALEFSKAGVSDVAGALGKVAGASIVDGKYVVVRGLADRYVTTTMNGLPIISADSSRKAVQLDLLPTFMVNQINVDKTYSAAQQGDFGGGAVDVITKFMPSKRSFKVEYALKHNAVNPDSFLYHSANEQSLWSGGQYQVAPDEGFVDPLNESFNSLLQQQSYVPRQAKAKGHESFKLEYSDVYEWAWRDDKKVKLGYTLGYSRAYEEEYEDSFLQNWSENAADPSYRAHTDEYQTSFTEAMYAGLSLEVELLSGINWGAYALEDNHKMRFLYFDTSNVNDIVYDRSVLLDQRDAKSNFFDGQRVTVGDLYTGGNGNAFAIPEGRTREIESLVREIEITQFMSEHRFSLSEGEETKHELALSWGKSDTRAIENRPFGISSTSTRLNFDTGLNEETFLRDRITTLFPASINDFLSDPEGLYYIGKPLSEFTSWEEFTTALREMTTRQPEAASLINSGIALAESDLALIQKGLPSVETHRDLSSGGDSDSLKNKIEKSKVTHEMDATRFDGQYSFIPREGIELQLSMGTSTLDQRRVSSGGAINFFPTGKINLGDPLIDSPLTDEDLLASPTQPDTFIDRLFAQNNSNNLISLDNSELNNYEGESDLRAQYWNLDLAWDGFRFGFGLRREKEKRSYKAISGFRLDLDRESFFNNVEPNPDDDGLTALPVPTDVTGRNKDGDLVTLRNAAIARNFENVHYLPSLYATRQLNNEKVDVGLFWSRTVARPTFFEFIPAKIANPDGFVTRGQVVSDTTIDNFDFSLRYTAEGGNQFGVALFYKYLDKPIYGLALSSGDVFYRNAEYANLVGCEFDARFQLTQNLTFKTNYTYIDGSFVYDPQVAAGASDPFVSTLAEQPKHIFNAVLGYDRAGYSVNLVYNYTGQYAALLRSVEGGPQYYRKSFGQIDLNMSKTFEFENFDFVLKGGIQNLLGTDEEFYIESENFPAANGQTWKSASRGRVYSIGGSLSF